MKKGKLIQTINVDDALWFSFEATDLSLKLLDKVFNLFEEFDFDEATTEYDYAYLIKSGQYGYVLENDSFLAYMVCTAKYINIILRKTKSYEETKQKILDNFEFVKK